MNIFALPSAVNFKQSLAISNKSLFCLSFSNSSRKARWSGIAASGPCAAGGLLIWRSLDHRALLPTHACAPFGLCLMPCPFCCPSPLSPPLVLSAALPTFVAAGGMEDVAVAAAGLPQGGGGPPQDADAERRAKIAARKRKSRQNLAARAAAPNPQTSASPLTWCPLVCDVASSSTTAPPTLAPTTTSSACGTFSTMLPLAPAAMELSSAPDPLHHNSAPPPSSAVVATPTADTSYPAVATTATKSTGRCRSNSYPIPDTPLLIAC